MPFGDTRRAPLAAALLLLAGCGGAGTPIPPAPEDAPELLIGDIEHLIDRAVAEAAVGDGPAAAATVDDAYDRFRRDVAPWLRGPEPDLLLRTEYAFGRLRDAASRSRKDAARYVPQIRDALVIGRQHVPEPTVAPGPTATPVPTPTGG